MLRSDIIVHIGREREAFRVAKRAGDRKAAWTALEREHILGQRILWPHIQSQLTMLGFAIETRDGREILDQAIQLALGPLGNLTGKLPWGNTGRSNVSAFKEMSYPKDLVSALSRKNACANVRTSLQP